MLLVLRALVALVFAGGAMTPLVDGTTTHSQDVAIQATVAADAAACEATPDEPAFSAAEDPGTSLALGFCVSDCSRCRTRDDCISPDFPNGAPCTPIGLCLSEGTPTR